MGATSGARGGRGHGHGQGISNLIQKLGMAANSPASEYNNDDEPNFDVAPPVPSILSNFSRPEDEDDEGSQFFGSSQGHGQQEEIEHKEHISCSPSPLDSMTSNWNSVDGMDLPLPMSFVVCLPTDLMPVVLYAKLSLDTP